MFVVIAGEDTKTLADRAYASWGGSPLGDRVLRLFPRLRPLIFAAEALEASHALMRMSTPAGMFKLLRASTV